MITSPSWHQPTQASDSRSSPRILRIEGMLKPLAAEMFAAADERFGKDHRRDILSAPAERWSYG